MNYVVTITDTKGKEMYRYEVDKGLAHLNSKSKDDGLVEFIFTECPKY